MKGHQPLYEPFLLFSRTMESELPPKPVDHMVQLTDLDYHPTIAQFDFQVWRDLASTERLQRPVAVEQVRYLHGEPRQGLPRQEPAARGRFAAGRDVDPHDRALRRLAAGGRRLGDHDPLGLRGRDLRTGELRSEDLRACDLRARDLRTGDLRAGNLRAGDG